MAVLRSLSERAPHFNFYQLLYLLERLFPQAAQIGWDGPSSDERIRLRVDSRLIFASSDVVSLSYRRFGDNVRRTEVKTSFVGLYGASSPLPTHFAEAIARAERQDGPQPVRELFDVLHHRLLSLTYRAWCKYRQGANYLSGGQDDFTRRMFCAVGLDRLAAAHTELDPFYFLRFAPLLATRSRSARGLRIMLGHVLAPIGVKIEPFVGRWVFIERPLRNRLGVQNHQLGENLVLGRYVYDGGSRYIIKLGPLQYDDYLSFLPGGHRRAFLRSIVHALTPGIHDAILNLQVDLDAAPRFQLGSPRASTLSRTMWLGEAKEQSFELSVPLDDVAADATADSEDDDRGEPPPCH